MDSDINFDELLQRFERNIYNSKRGEIRLAVVWRDLLEALPILQSGQKLRILDAGCGLGQIAERLLELGHELVLCDISEKMLTQTKQRLSSHKGFARIRFEHKSVQTLVEDEQEQFDLVLFHAVLEWLAKPWDVLNRLPQLLKSNGCLSLLFYNRDGLIFRNLSKGNLRKVKSGNYNRDSGSLTPLNPIDQDRVYSAMQAAGLAIIRHSGVRTFYDILDRKKRDSISIEDLIEMELIFSTQSPFREMGRYIHLLLQANK